MLPAIGDVIQGALRAGAAVADFITWAAGRALETMTEVVKTLLEAGVTIGELLIDTMQHPDHAFENLLKAMDDARRGDDRHRRGGRRRRRGCPRAHGPDAARRSAARIAEILEAALEVLGGAFGTVVSILFRLLASYRPMTAQEIADARTVFADKLDYSKIFFASESLANDIVFGVQDFVSGNPESRAFVSNNLVNFDVDEGIKRHTMIHELTHVWQAEFTGPFYMSEADPRPGPRRPGTTTATTRVSARRRSRSTTRHDRTRRRRLASSARAARTTSPRPNGDFEPFNREQQGQILMHYFVRKVLLNRPQADWAPWQPYVDFVQAA